MNTVTLIGNLTKDPEMKGGGDRKVCRMRIAEGNGSKKKESSLFIDVAAFGRQAETCNQYLKRGRLVAVSGRLRFRGWEAEDGGKRSEHSIAADRVNFLSTGNGRRPERDQEEEGGFDD
jgi:single-strand DNA-binding protein